VDDYIVSVDISELEAAVKKSIPSIGVTFLGVLLGLVSVPLLTGNWPMLIVIASAPAGAFAASVFAKLKAWKMFSDPVIIGEQDVQFLIEAAKPGFLKIAVQYCAAVGSFVSAISTDLESLTSFTLSVSLFFLFGFIIVKASVELKQLTRIVRLQIANGESISPMEQFLVRHNLLFRKKLPLPGYHRRSNISKRGVK